jgi:hypothetical protein
MNRNIVTPSTSCTAAIRRLPSGALDHAAYECEARRLRRAALARLVGTLAARTRAMLRGVAPRRATPCTAALPCR